VLVAVAEIGDKTQLLSFVLAARLRQPWAIIAGILVATIANHALAGLAGRPCTAYPNAEWLQ
jgi:putative Ca2+/H+ antiporter (TMEM165/GDT1 family)